jgi:hypothetical protein
MNLKKENQFKSKKAQKDKGFLDSDMQMKREIMNPTKEIYLNPGKTQKASLFATQC